MQRTGARVGRPAAAAAQALVPSVCQATGYAHLNRPQQQQQQWQRHRLRPCTRLHATAPSPPPGLSNAPWTGSEDQVAALGELKKRMVAYPYSEQHVSEDTMRWFLRDRKNDVEEVRHPPGLPHAAVSSSLQC